MNVEGFYVTYLAAKLSVPVHVSVPADRPSRFITVERDGGAWNSPITDIPSVTFTAWGTSRSDAYALCAQMDEAIRESTSEHGIARVEPDTTCVHYPDVESGTERYESGYYITTYE